MPGHLLALITISRFLSALAIRVEWQIFEEDVGAQPPLIFVHIHKSAGSHMCHSALLAGEHIVSPSANCNWQPYDDFVSRGRWDLNRTCAQRSEFFKKSGFTYGHIEREIRDEDLCHEGFRYGVLLRKPLARMLSHVSFEGMPREALLTDLRAKMLKGVLLQTEDESTQEEPDFRVLDNYQVRILANAMFVPAGGITVQHLSLAQERLKHFEVVGTVEALGTPEGRSRLLQGLGWSGRLTDTEFSSHENALQKKHMAFTEEEEDVLAFTEEEEQFLKEVNKHDLALYAWAQEQSKGLKVASPSGGSLVRGLQSLLDALLSLRGVGS